MRLDNGSVWAPKHDPRAEGLTRASLRFVDLRNSRRGLSGRWDYDINVRLKKMIISIGWCVLRTSRNSFANTSADGARIMDEAIDAADARLWASFREWMRENSSPLLLWTLHEHHNNHKGMLQVYLSRNHRASPFWEMLDWIAKHGQGSYGIFYVNDDEESENSGNVFRVLRIMNGRVDELPDPFFGPIVPNLEPEHPYDRDSQIDESDFV